MQEILIQLGYQPKEKGDTLEMAALYRGGDHPRNLVVFLSSNTFYDRKTGESGSVNKLLKLSGWTGKNINFKSTELPKYDFYYKNCNYPISCLDRLVKDFQFYNDKGIEDWVLEKFQCGIATKGRFKNRIVFPIFNKRKDKIIGFAGRDISGLSKLKWLIEGKKSDFSYPFHLSEGSINKKREIIIVESVGDALSLFNAGIDNVLCAFGIFLTGDLFKTIVSANPNKVYISLNSDAAGISGCNKMKSTLSNFFESGQIIVAPPTDGDFGDMDKESILEWKEKLDSAHQKLTPF